MTGSRHPLGWVAPEAAEVPLVQHPLGGMMTPVPAVDASPLLKPLPEDRVARLERLLVRLCWALAREGTAEDGNFGYASYGKELAAIVAELDP